ncbi:MAG: hypothetical protein HKO87_06725 [Acidimicrobiia bacterium]|nr:hypothetical protein [Acidimicrobiia bacterium]
MTLTFRRWKRRQVVAGNRYRTPAGIVEVTSVDIVAESTIADAEARAACHESAEALISDLPGDAASPIYRIAFRYVDEPDPRQLLAEDDELDESSLAEIDKRLDRLDKASKHGAWTRQVLQTIADHPHRRAPDLAEMYGRETQPFKTDVRKLKNLGLTLSFNPGYTLSPRGEAYLAAHRARTS